MLTKKVLSLFVALAMLFTLFPVTAAAAGYGDTANHWASAEITKWSNLGIISGNNGEFRPNDSITRGELAAILDRIMGYKVKAENSFVDLDQNWYTDAILRINAAGVLQGNNCAAEGAHHP